MHPRNEILFGHVLPEFLLTSRNLYGDASKFIELDNVEISEGCVDVPLTVDEELYEKVLTVYKPAENLTFSAKAVQCSQCPSEHINLTYSDENKISHRILPVIANILKIPRQEVTAFEIGKDARLIEVYRPEGTITSESDLTLINLEALQLVLDLSKPLKSIKQVQYPRECVGSLKIYIKKLNEELTNVKVFGESESRCCFWNNIRMDGESKAESAKGSDTEPEKEEEQSDPHLTEDGKRKVFQPNYDSPTIRCMKKVGFNCDDVDRHETFAEMGMSPLQCAEMERELQAKFPKYNIPAGIRLDNPTVAEMDAYLVSCWYIHNTNKS